MPEQTVYDREEIAQFQDFWADELAAAWLYRALADHAEPEMSATLRELADTEDRHAAHWAELLQRSTGRAPQPARIPLRSRVLAGIGRVFGVNTVLPVLVRLEAADATKYVKVDTAPDSMSQEETAHGQTLAKLGGIDQSDIAAREGRHRTGAGGALRAATFGVNDGLVSNLALVMGVAGGTSDPSIILLAGSAGLIAGAMSMAAGEWISVKSQRELFEREIAIERAELVHFPEEEERELVEIFRRKGVGRDHAEQLSAKLMANPDVALDTLAREELGLDPDELGSPWVAAGSSFVAFAAGALVPLAPFLFSTGASALWLAAIASALSLAAVGFSISLLTGRNGWYSALRMVAVGSVAAVITFAIGNLVGMGVF